MHRILYYILFLVMLTCVGCEWKLNFNSDGGNGSKVVVERYDRIESQYLTTGDFSALQQMNTVYPMQTRTLIEDVLRIGYVDDPEINSKFLNFYQDTTLQSLINEVGFQYANMDDINKELTDAFGRLRSALPGVNVPRVYAQIGSLDQSIIVGDNTLGISLDKYLGAGYPLYRKFYPESQRNQMVRSMIVPDCLVFYLLSLFPMPDERNVTQLEHDIHMGKISWVVNSITHRRSFNNKYVGEVERFMRKHRHIAIAQLLNDVKCSEIISD